MKWKINFEEDGSLLTITASGDPDIEGFRAYLKTVVNSPGWRPGMPVLCDFRKLDISKVTVEQVQQNAYLHKEFTDNHGTNPVAVIVSRAGDYGVVRLWETLAKDSYPEHKVFFSVEDGLKWLHQK